MGHQKATTTLNLYTHAPTDYEERVRTTFDRSAEFPLSFDLEAGRRGVWSDEEGGADLSK
jgi:hypothetical protein